MKKENELRLRMKVLVACFAMATPFLAKAQSGAVTKTSSAEDEVRSVVAQETAGWANFDAKAVASLYTRDAVWDNPFGVRLHGKTELNNFLEHLFKQPGYRSATDTSAPKIMDLHFASPTVAVVWSEQSSKDQVDDATGKPMGPRHSRYLEVLVKRDGTWKISDCLIMDELPLK